MRQSQREWTALHVNFLIERHCSHSFGNWNRSASEVQGQPGPTFVNDPQASALALMPAFAFSMPAQIVVNGLNLAMMCVLAIHLTFTTRYHYPLSKLNYLLQASSTGLLLLSLIVELHVILDELERKSRRYPYMFPYIGVQVPPPDDSWTVAQLVFYLLMDALTTLFAHVSTPRLHSVRQVLKVNTLPAAGSHSIFDAALSFGP